MKANEIILEASSPAQQAAIAINMKKHGKKPKKVKEVILGPNDQPDLTGSASSSSSSSSSSSPSSSVGSSSPSMPNVWDNTPAMFQPKMPKASNSFESRKKRVREADETDTVRMDIPLLLRMMEYAREDAKTDLDLHDVTEKMIALSKNHDYLCMDNYNEIVGSAAHDHVEESCPHCGGLMLPESRVDEKKDACYYKVKSRYKVWPSAYASGALVKCRKAGSKNWGNKSK